MKISRKDLIASALLSATLFAPMVMSGPAVHAAQPVIVQQQEGTTLSISGTAERQVAPDYAVLTLGIQTEAESVSNAKSKNDAIMSTMIANLQDLNIGRKDIQTTSFNVNPEYTYINNKNTLKGYTINNTVSVKIKDLDKISKVIDMAARAGGSNINGLQFGTEKSSAMEDILIKDAVDDARHHAEVLASALGMHIAGVKEVNMSSMRTLNPNSNPILYAKGAALSTDTPIESGQLIVSKTVNLVYILK